MLNIKQWDSAVNSLSYYLDKLHHSEQVPSRQITTIKNWTTQTAISIPLRVADCSFATIKATSWLGYLKQVPARDCLVRGKRRRSLGFEDRQISTSNHQQLLPIGLEHPKGPPPCHADSTWLKDPTAETQAIYHLLCSLLSSTAALEDSLSMAGHTSTSSISMGLKVESMRRWDCSKRHVRYYLCIARWAQC